MRGRKPKPAALKLLEGNRGKRKIQPEIQPDNAMPDAPPHLSPRARQIWDELGPEVNRLGLVTSVDWPAFAELCYAIAQSEKAREKLNDQGEVLELWADTGEEYILTASKRNPWCVVQKQAIEVIAKLSAEFGLTASSRARVAKPSKKPKENPLEVWLRKQNALSSKRRA